MRTTTASDDDPQEKANQMVMRLTSRESVTALQIQTLIGAISMLSGTRTNLINADEDSEKPELDGSVGDSLDASIVKMCDRLDTIVDESSRWNLKTQDQMESKLRKIYDTQLEALQAQKDACDNARAPHSQFKVMFSNLPDGRWAARFDGSVDPDGRLTGFGKTAAEALMNLHRNFYEGPQ